MSGLLIAAPSSGAGKTTITLGLLRALHKKGVALAPGKAGPDYIDPAYHAAASGEKCLNYDPWAMRRELLLANAALHRSGGKMLVIEAMMGLFDGAADGKGSPADLAATLGLSVILVVDCARMSHSVAALVSGFSNFRVDTRIAGVILNRVANDRHEAMLRFALESIRMPIFAIVRTDKELTLPESHLAFLKAGEQAELEEFIEHAAKAVSVDCDLSLLERASRQVPDRTSDANIARLPPPGQRVAVARDVAFAFSTSTCCSAGDAAGRRSASSRRLPTRFRPPIAMPSIFRAAIRNCMPAPLPKPSGSAPVSSKRPGAACVSMASAVDTWRSVKG